MNISKERCFWKDVLFAEKSWYAALFHAEDKEEKDEDDDDEDGDDDEDEEEILFGRHSTKKRSCS